MIEVEKFQAGHFEKILGYQYFVPHKVNDNWSWETPIINTLLEKAAVISNLSYKAANDLVVTMQAHGLLKEVTKQSRNRIFVFEQYLNIFNI